MNLPDAVRKNTLIDRPRYERLKQFIEQTEHLEGDVVEVGVYKGGTAYFFCQHTTKKVYLFDTFEGLPAVTAHDLHHKGDFKDTSIRHVTELLAGFTNFSIYQGVFPAENAKYVEFKKFSLVHLDVDIYPSVKECLAFFGTRMAAGGIIVLDDYNARTCPGAKVAADEYCLSAGRTVMPTVQSQAYIQF